MAHKTVVVCDGCGEQAPGEDGDLNIPGWVHFKLLAMNKRLCEGYCLLCPTCKTGPIPADALAKLEEESNTHSRWMGVPNELRPEGERA